MPLTEAQKFMLGGGIREFGKILGGQQGGNDPYLAHALALRQTAEKRKQFKNFLSQINNPAQTGQPGAQVASNAAPGQYGGGIVPSERFDPLQMSMLEGMGEYDPQMAMQLVARQLLQRPGAAQNPKDFLMKDQGGVVRDVRTGEPAFPGSQPKAAEPQRPRQFEVEFQRMIDTGMSPEEAKRALVNKERFKVIPNEMGRRVVWDAFQGRFLEDDEVGQIAQAEPAAPAASEPPDASLAVGPSGFWGGLANTIVPAIGGDLPAPETERATRAVQGMKDAIYLTLSEGLDSRSTNILRERIDNMSPDVGSLFEGKQRAKLKLEELRDFVKQNVQMRETMLENKDDFRTADVSKMRRQHYELSLAAREIDGILENFGQPESGGEAPRITSEEEWDALPSGATYYDPNGELRRKK